ncbi:MAG: MBL fold metallo-hydrolase [Chloroflexota bacterium]
MKVRLLGAHNCESAETRLAGVLVDEVLALDAGGLTASLSLAAQARLEAVLITHHHYDHLRDVPALAMNFFLDEATVDLYGTAAVRETLATNLLNDDLYPAFLEMPAGRPTINFTTIEPYRPFPVAGYDILAVPVPHTDAAVGYQVTSPDGKAVFYTADTGPGLAGCWEHVSPRLLVIEVTASNRFETFGREAGHMTPGLLQGELVTFREMKGYLPRVVTVHMNPRLEDEITAELAAVAAALHSPVAPGWEGMELHL